MKRILVDEYRRRNAEKRGGGGKVEALADSDTLVDKLMLIFEKRRMDLMACSEVLDDMLSHGGEHQAQAELICQHYFLGRTLEELADDLGKKPTQVRYQIKKGVDYMRAQLG